jgi:hypothetical protein
MNKRKFHEAFGKRDLDFKPEDCGNHKVTIISTEASFEAKVSVKDEGGSGPGPGAGGDSSSILTAVLFMKEKTLACYRMRKEFYELSSRFEQTVFLEVNAGTEECTSLLATRNVTVIPSVFLYKKGTTVHKIEVNGQIIYNNLSTSDSHFDNRNYRIPLGSVSTEVEG